MLELPPKQDPQICGRRICRGACHAADTALELPKTGFCRAEGDKKEHHRQTGSTSDPQRMPQLPAGMSSRRLPEHAGSSMAHALTSSTYSTQAHRVSPGVAVFHPSSIPACKRSSARCGISGYARSHCTSTRYLEAHFQRMKGGAPR